MSTLFSSCSIFQPLRATAESVADTCSSKVVLFCVTLYVNWFPAIVSPITNKFSKKHNIIIPKNCNAYPYFFFTICPSINSDLQCCLFPFSDLRSESSERSNRIGVNELVNSMFLILFPHNLSIFHERSHGSEYKSSGIPPNTPLPPFLISDTVGLFQKQFQST